MIALCSSNKCTGGRDGLAARSVVKENVSKYAIECPDCKSILRWVKFRAQRINMAGKGRPEVKK